MFGSIWQLLDAPMFILGIFIGVILCIVVCAVYVICMILFGVVDPDESGVKKTLRARMAEKKERNHRGHRAVTNATNMVADGCLELPRR